MKHLSINLIAIFVASQTLLIAQTNLDQYKYVSVPNRFDFMKSSDLFLISSLAKLLLTKSFRFLIVESRLNPLIISLICVLGGSYVIILSEMNKKMKKFLLSIVLISIINSCLSGVFLPM